jgi:hypothetical protein
MVLPTSASMSGITVASVWPSYGIAGQRFHVGDELAGLGMAAWLIVVATRRADGPCPYRW